MKNRAKRLIIDQISRNLATFQQASHIPVPSEGWIRTIRKAMNMSLLQLSKKLNRKPPTLLNFEKREKAGTITLRSLNEIAEAMGMRLVYAILPKEETLAEMVDRKAEEKAKEIINRTHNTMALEDQGNEKARLMDAFIEKKNELKTEMPKFLWD